ncbi:MAG: L-serine ammonia-lyase [Anaerolineaceae bacterium]|nr:L-serine ammonia-lyase [Anaerolineaceae bacterium]
MKSIQKIYRIGYGPSSSHTMAPRKAAEQFKAVMADRASRYQVTLLGSLAATGRGHLTDIAIQQALAPVSVEILWDAERFLSKHPNAMIFEAYDNEDTLIDSWTGYSIGGGALVWEGKEKSLHSDLVYPHSRMNGIMQYCTDHGLTYWEYVEQVEGSEIWPYLAQVWEVMQQTIENGLHAEGVLPGGLGLSRNAWRIYTRTLHGGGLGTAQNNLLFAYALATAEENAAGGKMVTAPTCGSSGVLPAVLRYIQENTKCTETSILRALATAGLIGNLVKANASISGAVVGCQGEIGTACTMAAAAATQLLGGSIRQIEYAAEMGLEHHLGLTCDPVDGLVQIPCIERNAFAAQRAIGCANYALMTDGMHRVSLDEVIEVMETTGHDLPSLYRETSQGGLAKAHYDPDLFNETEE